MTEHDSEWIYAGGTVDPIAWACTTTADILFVRDSVTTARKVDPDAFPAFAGDIDDAAFARRIVGRLLDAGWTPPLSSAASPATEALHLVLHAEAPEVQRRSE